MREGGMGRAAAPGGVLSRRTLLRISAATAAAAAVTGGTAGAAHALAAPADGPVALPAPSGPYAVGTGSFHLVDDARTDPFAPTPTARELMVQVWYATAATAGRERARYLDPALVPVVEQRFTLPAGSLARVRTETWQDAPVHPELCRAPVVFLGPGRQDPAATLTAFATDLASHGYLVIGVNHTYDGPVRFPDGRVVPQNPATGDAALLRQYSDVRGADLSFVLDAFTGQRGQSPAPQLTAAMSRERIGVFGHSLGGSGAAEVLRRDARFTAGACLDGALQTAAAQTGLAQPFMLFTENMPKPPPSWAEFMAHHRGWGRRMILDGARHYSFTDLAPLGVGLGLDRVWPPEQFAKYFGTLEGRRSQFVTGVYVRAFFDRWLKGREEPVLDAADGRFPEVTVGWKV